MHRAVKNNNNDDTVILYMGLYSRGLKLLRRFDLTVNVAIRTGVHYMAQCLVVTYLPNMVR